MTVDHDTTTTPAPTTIDTAALTAVGRLLTHAATLVRVRGERGETPGRDHRPRMREAIARAAHLTGLGLTPGDRPVWDWAIRLAAMEVNAALGRGRHRDGGDLTQAVGTLAGYSVDVGALGAVNAAAELLGQAARTASLIAAAGPVPVHGYRDVVAYFLGATRPTAIEVDDIVAAIPDSSVVNVRARYVRHHGDGAYSFGLDTAPPREPIQARASGNFRLTAVWRPVPHLPDPWHLPPAVPTGPGDGTEVTR